MSRENLIISSRLGDSGKTESRKKEIPTPTNKYLFLDLDMTLIDESYKITDPRIFKNIERLQDKGWELGLNSNTPLEPLMVWTKYFGMKGPTIAEKGAVIFDNGKVIFNKQHAKIIQTSIRAIKEGLKTANIQWFSGNPVDVIRDGKYGDLRPGPLVLLNTVRKCSLNYYIREVTSNGQIVINPSMTTSIIEKLRKYYPNSDDFEENLHHENGILLIMPRGQTKKAGTLVFMENKGLTQIGIIGDSMNDFLGEDKVVHYAVGNAKEDYKTKAVFVSKFPMTKGCIDILARLAK